MQWVFLWKQEIYLVIEFGKYYLRGQYFFFWKISLKMRKLTLKPDCLRDVLHREQMCHTFCSGQSRAGTVHDIHNLGRARLASGGTDVDISVEPGLHQDLSCCLVFIQDHLPTSAVSLLQCCCHFLPCWDYWHILLAWKLEQKIISELLSHFLNENILFMCTCTQ